MTLKGYQLSFVNDVEPYWIENPPRPISLKTGDWYELRLLLHQQQHWVHAQICETGTEANWSGVIDGEKLTGQIVVNRAFLENCRPLSHPPEQNTRGRDEIVGDRPKSNTKSSRRKRYSGKGRASGWVETRKTNRKRERPSSYLVYR